MMNKQQEALKMAISVLRSINEGKRHLIITDDDRGFFQREEWVRWAVDEVLPIVEEALEHQNNMVTVPLSELNKLKDELKELRKERKEWQGFGKRVSRVRL